MLVMGRFGLFVLCSLPEWFIVVVAFQAASVLGNIDVTAIEGAVPNVAVAGCQEHDGKAFASLDGRIVRTCLDDSSGRRTGRCYFTFLPDCAVAAANGSESSAIPLVVDFHRHGVCPGDHAGLSGWYHQALKHCFAVVWPTVSAGALNVSSISLSLSLCVCTCMYVYVCIVVSWVCVLGVCVNISPNIVSFHSFTMTCCHERDQLRHRIPTNRAGRHLVVC